jgi:hypothetical protein
MTETVTKRHPIRGFLYGIVFGLGLMMLAVGQGSAALGPEGRPATRAGRGDRDGIVAIRPTR